MASPHVAGVVALIKRQALGLDDAQVKAKLLQAVDQKASLQGKVATNGRLNAARSLTEYLANPTTGNADTTKPRVSSPRPTPDGSTSDRTPNIAATETDAETELRQDSINSPWTAPAGPVSPTTPARTPLPILRRGSPTAGTRSRSSLMTAPAT
jgi:hypothetical protein